MTEDAEYFCPACGGSAKVTFGRQANDGEVVDEGVSDCWACNHTGRVGEQQVYRHRLILLAHILAERAVALRQDTALRRKSFALEGEKHGMGVETYAEVKTMETQGYYESELSTLRSDLVETLFDMLAVPKPERWIGKLQDGEEVPF